MQAQLALPFGSSSLPRAWRLLCASGAAALALVCPCEVCAARSARILRGAWTTFRVRRGHVC